MKHLQESQYDNAFGRNQWFALLDFCHDRGQFEDLRDLTIKRISTHGVSDSAIGKVLMGRKYRCKSWIVDGLTELVNAPHHRVSLPTLSELRVLGEDTALTILYMIYETSPQNRGYNYKHRHADCHEVEGKFEREIATYRYDP